MFQTEDTGLNLYSVGDDVWACGVLLLVPSLLQMDLWAEEGL